MSLASLSLTQASDLLQRREISSRELTAACLEAIAAKNAQLNAFLFIDEAGALKQAEAADALLRSEETVSPLCGLPLAVKDVLAVEGMPCTCGSKILQNYLPPFTATAVRRLQQAGMVIVGKTNTDEFAMGSSTENSAYGVTRNPWNLQRVPGGSSGGSAAAVAARLTPAALGSDTGGSVRQPAAFCGVTGLKPTYGRVSRFGLTAYGSSLDVVGVFGHAARDTAAVLTAMQGVDALDATSQTAAAAEFSFLPEPNLKGLRLGLPREYFLPGVQPEVQQRVRQALSQFEALGAEIIEISLPHTEFALPVYYLLAPAEASANLARFDGVRFGPRQAAQTMWEVFTQTRGELFGSEVKRRIMLGTYALSAGYYDAFYAQAQKVRTLIRRDFEQAFEKVDAIACPVAPTTAFGIGAHGDDPLAMYLEDVFTLPANLAGIPALAFPVGFDSAGLPVGMQLMAPAFSEASLLRLADAFQQVTDWHTRTPGKD